MNKKTSYAGSFYPESPDELNNLLETIYENLGLE